MKKTFASTQGLGVHVKRIHGIQASLSADKENKEKGCQPTKTPTQSSESSQTITVEVKEVVDSLINRVVKKVNTSKLRKGYMAECKAKILQEYEKDVQSQRSFALTNNLSQSQILRWQKEKAQMIDEAAKSRRKLLTKNRKPRKYKELNMLLYSKFKEARHKGHRVDLTGFRLKPDKFKDNLLGRKSAN